ncbi:MAG: 50S ribosomal protein L11 methyltransferase [Rhodospirillales bacterium]|nr:50S ribosomal protein L11 methyltransferase [Rhodospirillales bacterium]
MSLLPDLWRAALVVAEDQAAAFETAFEPHCETVARFAAEGQDEGDGGLWLVEGLARHPPDRPALIASVAAMAAALAIEAPELVVERLAARDWLADNRDQFPPIRAGRFLVRGSHIEGPAPAGTLALVIDAGRAFGSGEHASSWGCLMALDRLARIRPPRRVLDVGCGSGILGLAAARLWRVPTLVADIDPDAVAVAADNARRNRAAAWITAHVSNGYRHPAIGRHRPYDLIFANILARPLVSLAPALATHLAPGGHAVLAGLLERQERMVLAAHRAHGLALSGRVCRDGWSCLILKKADRGSPGRSQAPR